MYLGELLNACTKSSPIVIKLHEIQNKKFRNFCDSKCLYPIGVVRLLKLYLKNKIFNPRDIKHKLAIVSIVKNEGSYLEEWINYYTSIDIDHIYIYDNESSDNTEEICNKYSSKVSYFKIRGKMRQCDAYNDALNRYGNLYEYMAMIDGDEFIFAPPTNENVLDKITNYFQSDRKVGGLAINWAIFGSSGYTEKPNGKVTDNFIYRANDDFEKNKHVKTVCNPRRVAGFVNPHYAVYLPGYYAVDTENNVTRGAFTKLVHNKVLRINHYFTKSKEEFLAKRARGMADNLDIRDISDFDEHNRNEIFDDSLKKYNDRKL